MTGKGNPQENKRVPKTFCQIATISCSLLYKQNLYFVASHPYFVPIIFVPGEKSVTPFLGWKLYSIIRRKRIIQIQKLFLKLLTSGTHVQKKKIKSLKWSSNQKNVLVQALSWETVEMELDWSLDCLVLEASNDWLFDWSQWSQSRSNQVPSLQMSTRWTLLAEYQCKNIGPCNRFCWQIVFNNSSWKPFSACTLTSQCTYWILK